jgi:RNA polymerase sigma-70 factor (ECF subfamily)
MVARSAREGASFEALVKEHQDRVYDFCCRMLGDAEEASDVAQEVFVSVHQHLAEFRAGASMSTWLLRIARNQCLNRLKYLRRRGRGRSDALSDASEEALSEAQPSPKPDEALEVADAKAVVRRAIDLLEEEQRLLVVLRDLEGLSYEEIATVADLPLGTVKSRLHRARERLAELIDEDEV